MMKRIILLLNIVLLLLINDSYSQDESFLGLTFGTAIPQGKYAEQDFYDKSTGYANTGFMFSFDGAWFPDDYLGIGGTVTFASNNPDKNAFKEDLRQFLNDSVPDIAEVLDENFVVDYGVWKYLNIFIGPSFTYPIGRLNIDARILAGVSFGWQPSQEIDATDVNESTFSRKVSGKAVPALGYCAGGGVRYAFKSGYVLRVTAEWVNSKPKFEYTSNISYEEDGQDITIEIEKESYEMPFKNVHLGIGIAYNFNM